MTLLLGGLVLPAFVVLVGGRMASFSSSAGTAQDRLGLWADAFMLLKTDLAALWHRLRQLYPPKPAWWPTTRICTPSPKLGVIGGVLFLGAFAFQPGAACCEPDHTGIAGNIADPGITADASLS